jgi:hypothetical protein
MPLRLPSGWAVVFNNFVEFSDDSPPTDADFEAYRDEDLLSVEAVSFDGKVWRTDESGLLIDVGWYPAGDPAGSYRLALVRGGWDDVPARFEHRNCYVVKEAIDLVVGMLARGSTPEEVAELLDDLADTMTGMS